MSTLAGQYALLGLAAGNGSRLSGSAAHLELLFQGLASLPGFAAQLLAPQARRLKLLAEALVLICPNFERVRAAKTPDVVARLFGRNASQGLAAEPATL